MLTIKTLSPWSFKTSQLSAVSVLTIFSWNFPHHFPHICFFRIISTLFSCFLKLRFPSYFPQTLFSLLYSTHFVFHIIFLKLRRYIMYISSRKEQTHWAQEIDCEDQHNTGHSCRGVNPESHSEGLWSIGSQAVLAPLQQLICRLPDRSACTRRLLSAASASADKRSTALCGTTAPPAAES